MEEVASLGRTVLLVSHNMGAINQLCTKALMLVSGRLELIGPTDQVVSRYLLNVDNSGAERDLTTIHHDDGAGIQFRAIRVLSYDRTPSAELDVRMPFWVELEFQIDRPFRSLVIAIRVVARDGTVVFVTRNLDVDNESQRFTRSGH